MGKLKSYLNKAKAQQEIQEATMSRIWQYVEDDTKSFGIISAFRAKDPDNMENFKQLCNIVYKKMGYGYIMMRGEYREFSGELSQELSLFIPGITKEKLIKLGQQFNQDSVLYKDKKEFVLIGTNSDTGVGNIREKYKAGAGKENISLAKEVLKDFFSSLLKGRHKDKKFAFNKLEEYKELGWMMRMGGYKPFWFNILQEKNEA